MNETLRMRWIATSSDVVRGFAAAAVIALLASCGGPATYASPQDCVLENVGKAQTEAAVSAIQRACDDMFPELVAQQRNLRIAQQVAQEQRVRAREDAAETAANAAAATVADSPGATGESP